MIGQGSLQRAFQVIQPHAIERLAGKLADGSHRREHLVAPCLGEQRAVVALPQILVAAAQVDYLRTPRNVVAVFKVILGQHQALAGKVAGPVFLALHHDQQAVTGAPLTGWLLGEGYCGNFGFGQYFGHVGLHR
ncbi:hypothetical protein D3C71_1840580 [compost metagenome]